MSYNYLFDSYSNLLDKYRKGESKEGLRWLTKIDKESISLVKKFQESGIQVKHIKNMPPLSFGVSEKEVAITIEKMIAGKMSESFLISSEPLYVNHFISLFNELWKSGISAEERIRDIEDGIDAADIEIIQNSAQAIDRAWDISRSAETEICIMFSSSKVLERQIEMGGLETLRQASELHQVNTRILVPSANELIS